MKWSRRHFLAMTGGMAAAAGVGLVPRLAEALPGKAVFSDWRALPGMRLDLRLEVEHPEETEVEIIAMDGEHELDRIRMKGAENLVVPVPYFRVGGESFLLFAEVSDVRGRSLVSDSVEVISEEFHFGM